MNKKYKDKFAMWEVHDDGENKLGEYETLQDFQAALSTYYKNANMEYCFGCLCWLGQVSHIELRFKDTALYSDRQKAAGF